MSASHTPRKQPQATLSLIEFVRPDGSWPYPYSLEQAFELLRRMVASGRKYFVPGCWGQSGVLELLYGGGVVNCGALRPIESLSDLRRCLHRALLGIGNDAVERWRRRQHFRVTSTRTLTVPHYHPFRRYPFQGHQVSEHDIFLALTRYFHDVPGTRLPVSLNAVHLQARRVSRAIVDIDPDFFRFRIEYGLAGSAWSHTLAITRRGESFLDTFDRAWSRYRLLTEMAAREPDLFISRLNQEEKNASESRDLDPPCWVRLRRPVQAHAVETMAHFALVPLGHGPSLNLVHWPSGRVVLTRRQGPWEALRRTALQLECRRRTPPTPEALTQATGASRRTPARRA